MTPLSPVAIVVLWALALFLMLSAAVGWGYVLYLVVRALQKYVGA